MIYTKVGDRVTDIWIDTECYSGGKLIQVHGTVEGQSRLLYISDLKEDTEKEIQDVVKAAMKNPGPRVRTAPDTSQPQQ